MDEKELVHIFEKAMQDGAQELDLSNQEIKSIPAEIFSLSRIKKLNLSSNLLSVLPSEIGDLAELQNLDLHNNLISSLPYEIERLENLRVLNLSNNQLNELPSAISKLNKIWELDLSNNLFSEFPKQVLGLINLQALHLKNNKISLLPTEIEHLRHIQVLNLSNNQLTYIPLGIGKIQSLIDLDLSNNKLSHLPFGFTNLINLAFLDLQKNPIPIPDEILSKTSNPESILNYYQKLLVEKRQGLNEAKVLIVGQGSVGKTSLVNRIARDSYAPNQNKTDGIAIESLSITTLKNEKVRLNIWDFGGQEIMHATHQFFLTRRSLYVLVLDSRLTQEENRVEYWLKLIQSFGGDSPIIIVGNKTDQHPLDIDKPGLIKKYPLILDVIETSASSGKGIEELKSAIAKGIEQLPHVHDPLLESWFTVKKELESIKNDYISYDDYIKVCINNEISDEVSQKTLIGFLHDLGVILHFQDDTRLVSLGILNPEWVTNGVYKIINSNALFKGNGVLESAMLLGILDHKTYPFDKYMFIIDMMKKFELCYDIVTDKKFLVPDLLPKNEPEGLIFNGIPAFEYLYPVLPPSIMTRFIVRMNLKNADGLVWRTGVMLKIGNNRALVKADLEDRKITIAIDGPEHTRRDALSAIRYQLDEIHESIKGLDAQKRVPIAEAPNAEPLDYDYLLQLERDGFEELPVKDGNRLVVVNVKKLLSAVISENERKQESGNVTKIYIGGDVKGGTIIAGDENEVKR